MKNILILLLIAGGTWIAGCNSNEHHETGHNATTNHTTEESDGVQLNNGEKWLANPETTQGIAAMQELVGTYKVGDEAGALQQKLLDEFNTILQKCTMKGEAHNQLHVYLVQVKTSIAGLEHCNDNCKEEVRDIEMQLKKYEQYFQ